MQRAIEEVADFARVIHLNLQQTSFGKADAPVRQRRADGTLGGQADATATMARVGRTRSAAAGAGASGPLRQPMPEPC